MIRVDFRWLIPKKEIIKAPLLYTTGCYTAKIAAASLTSRREAGHIGGTGIACKRLTYRPSIAMRELTRRPAAIIGIVLYYLDCHPGISLLVNSHMCRRAIFEYAFACAAWENLNKAATPPPQKKRG